ncbi:MAG: hypothetical protein L3I99_05500 [Sulfurimonas sp.]|nr:hypothetical protein [Sulfurimonas sp.]
MHIIESHDDSMIVNIHNDSIMAKEMMSDNGNTLKGEHIKILQIAYVENATRNIFIEFVYKEKNNKKGQ